MENHRCVADVARLSATHVLDASVEVTVAHERDAHRLGFGSCLGSKACQGDEDSRGAREALTYKRASKGSDLVDPYLVRDPPLALYDRARVPAPQLKIDVSVRTILSASFLDRPAFATEDFAH